VSTVGPVDHLPRATLPWRTAPDLTECGKPIADLPAERVITVAALQKRIRDVGKQRAAFTACVTCMDTAERHHRHAHYARGDGGGSGVEALGREIEALRYVYPPSNPTGERGARATALWARRQRLEAELEAIAALVAEHRDEFDGYLAGRDQAVSLAARRAQVARRVRQRPEGTL
jgi:hypothetical protein